MCRILFKKSGTNKKNLVTEKIIKTQLSHNIYNLKTVPHKILIFIK